MKAYTLHSYDVWGNAEDGYDVNDVYPSQATIELADNASDAEILAAIEADDNVEIDHGISDIDYAIYFVDKNDRKPIGELRVKQ